MAGVDNYQVLAMMGMRPMTTGGNHSAYAAVIEGKGAKMLGDQNDGVTLALVEQNAREGMIFPLANPSDLVRLYKRGTNSL